MNNNDICVCCGTIVPEGTMVCIGCQKRNEIYRRNDAKLVEEIFGLKPRLRWYQKLLFKIRKILQIK